jgi:YidC/Oxa1 family membrane protein insertase
MGGRPVSVRLKEHTNYNGSDLYLFTEDSSAFAFEFLSQNRKLSTADLFFQADKNNVVAKGEDNSGEVSLKLMASDNQYIEFVYSISGNSYDVDYDVNFVGLNDLVADNRDGIQLYWQLYAPAHEKGFENEDRRSSIFFKPVDENRDYISEASPERVDLENNIEWIAFKQQYFSAAILADQPFTHTNGYLETQKGIENGSYTKNMIMNVGVPINATTNSIGMQFFFGPNDYEVLVAKQMDGILDLGWGIFGWVSKWFVMPLFNLLTKMNVSYGIVILLLTFLIKLILSPLTYKSYLSGAKMRVLKPEIEELNKKLKDADPMKKQQETMALYKKAGANPMAGCLPMVLQMPILYAMFMLFPASIKLRGESFLWAEDLSTYDSVYDLPFTIPLYGDHISLFTIFMAFSMFFYTRSNMSSGTMGGGGAMQAQQMKIMMYFMPVMLLVWFNNYSAGLSYYYLCANLTSIGQNWAFRKFLVNDEEVHAMVQENKKKPVKKSKFTARLEKMAKDKGVALPKK